MRKLNALLIGDDPAFGRQIKMVLDELNVDLIDCCDSIAEYEKNKNNGNLDLILSDFKLSCGLLMCEYFLKNDRKGIPLIYFSASVSKELYTLAKASQPSAILIKPINSLTVRNAIENSLKDNVLATNGFSKTHFFIKERSQIFRINHFAIEWIHADGNYCLIYKNMKKYVVRTSLVNILGKLPKDIFIRVHRNHIVNINQINSLNIKSNVIELNGGTIPIGRSYKKQLLSKIEQI